MDDKRSLYRLVFSLLIFAFVVFTVVLFFGKLPLFGRLPGDVTLRFSSHDLFLPVTSSIILGFLLTVLGYIVMSHFKK
jgi:hypothetical protein